MSYRGIKRVLGESKLERKIRILFGLCLLALIGGSFWRVSRITENLIRENTREKAKSLTTDFILRTHLRNVSLPDTDEGRIQAELFESLASEGETVIGYKAETLVLDQAYGRWQLTPQLATDTNEVQRLTNLLAGAKARQTAANRAHYFDPESESSPKPDSEPEASLPSKEAFEESIVLPESEEFTFGGNYVFYAPVVFKSVCIRCHRTALDPESATFAEFEQRVAESEGSEFYQVAFEKSQLAPPAFLRITLNNHQAKGAIDYNRAILATVAIITVVCSVGAIWLIIRYVIVKPLKHLQDVADQIRDGQLNLRADLKSGDEFEALARSFNKMLHHLMDTQMALQDVNDDLDRKVDEQAQLNLKLYEMNQVKSEFLANMSHELRTPLNSIIGFSEILEAGQLADKQLRFAANIKKSGRLLLDLINDILDLAKLEAGMMEIRPSEFSINQLCTELSDMVRTLAEKKNIKLSYEGDEDFPMVFQDKIKVRQILTNLLSNAIKFTPEGGRIRVAARRNDSERLILKVSDTGVGIAEADQEIIFEKFRQGPSALGNDSLTREVSGTGLGLSIVKELCILLGGSISQESQVGKGSTFTVRIPWTLKVLPRINSEIKQSIDEIVKSQRVDFARTNLTPKPPDPQNEEVESTN